MIENPNCWYCGNPLYYTGKSVPRLDNIGMRGQYTVHHCLKHDCKESGVLYIKYKDGKVEELKKPLYAL